MHDDKLTAALDVLLEQLNAQVREVSETKRTINGLRRRMGEDALFPDENENADTGVSAIRPDQFYGKPLATAVQQFLERRKGAASAEDILRGLEQGGFDFRQLGWGEADRQRILAISLAKNNVTFHKLPNNTFGIRSWYDETILKRSEKKAAGSSKRGSKRNHSKSGNTGSGKEKRQGKKQTAPPAVTGEAANSKPKSGGQRNDLTDSAASDGRVAQQSSKQQPAA